MDRHRPVRAKQRHLVFRFWKRLTRQKKAAGYRAFANERIGHPVCGRDESACPVLADSCIAYLWRTGYRKTISALRKKPNIIVATPGRLMNHMKRGTIDLSHVQILVLDEGDEMVDMGFIDDIRTILAGMPEERQTMFFSATMPAPIRELAKSFLRDPGACED